MSEQGSFDWYKARWGMVTMSQRIGVVMRGSIVSKNNLLMRIQWEREQGDDVIREHYERENHGLIARNLRWGKEHEAAAVNYYAMTRNVSLERRGFMADADFPDLAGGSVDFIEKDDHGVPAFVGEVKCPASEAAKNHLRALHYGMPLEHTDQVQGNMAVTKLTAAKFISYDPRQHESMKLYVQTIPVDPIWQADYRAKLEEFGEYLKADKLFKKPSTETIPSLF